MRTLVIGNRCYSSWSLRPWLLMKTLGIPFKEVQVQLDRPDTAASVAKYSPAGRVPVLVDGDTTVWDSIAIVEYIAENIEPRTWPEDRKARALARSIVAEMHAGFQGLRGALPMNLGKRYAWRDRPEIVPDLARIQQIVMDTRKRFGAAGPFLFGTFSAADAYYAPVMTRLDTYAVPVDAKVRKYVETILGLPAFQEWKAAALEEPWVLADDEVTDKPSTDLRQAKALA